MADYQKMYTTLFNAITDVMDILQRAQQETEELYLSTEPPTVTVLEQPDNKSNFEQKI